MAEAKDRIAEWRTSPEAREEGAVCPIAEVPLDNTTKQRNSDVGQTLPSDHLAADASSHVLLVHTTFRGTDTRGHRCGNQ